MSAFQLTPSEQNDICNTIRRDVPLPSLWQFIEKIVNSRWPEAPRWIPVTERMPTAADGMKGSTWAADGVAVLWMMPESGCFSGPWNQPPTGAIAWCRIPDYEPPVPTPEDKSREGFEKWVITELDDQTERYENGKYVSENVRCAWAAWQAARAEGGSTP